MDTHVPTYLLVCTRLFSASCCFLVGSAEWGGEGGARLWIGRLLHCVNRPAIAIACSSQTRTAALTHQLLASFPSLKVLPVHMADLARLGPHPVSRNAALSKVPVASGSVVATVQALATSLLPPEKGRRCDGCHVLKSDSVTLKRCSGCASFWYCGAICAKICYLADTPCLLSVQTRSKQGLEATS